MSLKTLSVRIPDVMHSYIKHRTALTGKSMQETLAEIIYFYQINDQDYLDALHQSVDAAYFYTEKKAANPYELYKQGAGNDA